MLPDTGSMAGGFFATSISGKMPAGIEASFTHLLRQSSKYAMLIGVATVLMLRALQHDTCLTSTCMTCRGGALRSMLLRQLPWQQQW